MKGRIILERGNKESFNTSSEISEIKEVELFVSPTGEKIKLLQQIWMDPEGWRHAYNTLEKRGNNFLSAFCASRSEMRNAF